MNKKRFFWESGLATWIEDKLFVLSDWYANKRYPVESWSVPEPTTMPPTIDREYVDSLSFHTEIHNIIVAPKTKKSRKNKSKKAA
jgi:hypothetical protein